MSNPIVPLIHQLRSGDLVLALVLLLLGSWTVLQVLRLVGVMPQTRIGSRYAAFASQVGILLALEQAYEFTRGRIPYRTDIALTHAYQLLDFEWRHGFFIESRVERFFLQFQPLMNVIYVFYVFAHLLVTIGAVVWIYTRRRQHYSFVRNLLIVTTGIALIAFYVYPTAPPRLLPNYGFVDPLQLHHFVSEGGAQPGSYTYNPYAAMPSLHVAYSLVVGWSVFLAERTLWVRFLACLYPLAMSAAVVISANHWLLDVFGAFVTVALAGSLLFALNGLQVLVFPRVRRATGWVT